MTDRRGIYVKRRLLAGTAALVYSDESMGLQAFELVCQDGAVRGLGFSATRCKPDYHFRFDSPHAAAQHREKWAAGKRSSFEAKKKRAAARREGLCEAAKP